MKFLVLTLYADGEGSQDWQAVELDGETGEQREVTGEYVCREVVMEIEGKQEKHCGVFFGRPMTDQERLEHAAAIGKRGGE